MRGRTDAQTGRGNRIGLPMAYGVLLAVAAVDQLSKIAVRRSLPIGESRSFWPGVLRFTHIENTGAAGSSFEGWGRIFIPVALAVVAWVVYAQRKGKLDNAWLAAGAGFSQAEPSATRSTACCSRGSRTSWNGRGAGAS